jgi:DNA invertase Pin-like site-specific DNA recombinase
MSSPKRIAYYLRSATGNLADLKHQRKSLDRELVRRGFDQPSCLIEIYQDTHQSGLRPGSEFVGMSRDVVDKKIDVVMVARLNRISRAPNGLLKFFRFVETHRIRFISPRENTDSIYWHFIKPQPTAGGAL